MGEDRRRDRLVDENAPVLGVVAEFDDVESAIVRLDEMSLRAASHFPDEAARVYRQGLPALELFGRSFFATAFLATAFLATAFFATAFFARLSSTAFFATAFAAVFFTAVFFATAFLTALFWHAFFATAFSRRLSSL